LARIEIYCANCFGFRGFGRDAGPGGGGCEWIEMCDWCAETARKKRVEVARLEAIWAVRECAADDCDVVFTPARAHQRYHDERCRKRMHWRLKASKPEARLRSPASQTDHTF
jgi:hypothetical protein